ncbi:MAG: hypothetical protein OXF65_00490 [Acidimicrobiaceae bacterium]|nr:hypothetical protein [Acidimicrobiaceae bacterium]
MPLVLCRNGFSHDCLSICGHVKRFALHYCANCIKVALRLCCAEFAVKQPPHELREADPLFRSAPLRLGVEMIRQRDDRSHGDIIASPSALSADLPRALGTQADVRSVPWRSRCPAAERRVQRRRWQP